MIHLVILFGFPFLGIGLGVLSILEILGRSWHRPHFLTRAPGGVGLLATSWIGLQWLVVAAAYALYFWEAVWIIDMNGLGR